MTMTTTQFYILLTLLGLILIAILAVAVSLQRMLHRSSPRQRVVLPLTSGVNVLPDPKTCTAQITSRAQNGAFRPERIVIGGNPSDWIVNDIRIRNVTQFVQSGDVPGEMFASSAIDCFLRMDAVGRGDEFQIVATYIGDRSDGAPFICGVLGTAVSDREVQRSRDIDRPSSLGMATARAAA